MLTGMSLHLSFQHFCCKAYALTCFIMTMKFVRVMIIVLSLLVVFTYLLLKHQSMSNKILLAVMQNKPSACPVFPDNQQASDVWQEGTLNDCITGEVILHTNNTFPMLSKRQSVPIQLDVTTTSDVANHSVRQDSFVRIFKSKLWGSEVDVTSVGVRASGHGSSLNTAQDMTAVLHLTIDRLKRKLGVKKIRLLDVPCGDLQWMNRFLQTRDDVIYTGMDIVPQLIENHKNRFAGKPWRFIVHDAVEKEFEGAYDLILSRAVLQHLYEAEAIKMLTHLSNSGSSYLLVTTFPTLRTNKDVDRTGGFRHLNINLEPFSLSPPLCLHADDDGRTDRIYIGLWSLPLRRISNCSLQEYSFKDIPFYGCF